MHFKIILHKALTNKNVTTTKRYKNLIVFVLVGGTKNLDLSEKKSVQINSLNFCQMSPVAAQVICIILGKLPTLQYFGIIFVTLFIIRSSNSI
jgi:hypothetical protein